MNFYIFYESIGISGYGSSINSNYSLPPHSLPPAPSNFISAPPNSYDTHIARPNAPHHPSLHQPHHTQPNLGHSNIPNTPHHTQSNHAIRSPPLSTHQSPVMSSNPSPIHTPHCTASMYNKSPYMRSPSSENRHSSTNHYPALFGNEVQSNENQQIKWNSAAVFTKQHEKDHNGNEKHPCTICNRVFATKRRLTNHMKKKHIMDGLGEQCKVCEKVFPPSELQKHMRTHVNPYKCSVCKKGFRYRYDLSVHERTHNDEKPHQCEICKLVFVKETDLERHMKTHAGKTLPYQCPVRIKLTFISS